MSARTRPTKYSTDPELHRFRQVCTPLAVPEHAIEQYRDRLPRDAVPPALAWERSERVMHPETLATFHDTPDAVRIYAHDGQYWAVFVIEGGVVKTVYNAETHEHPPTRAYIRAHGPHYREERGGR